MYHLLPTAQTTSTAGRLEDATVNLVGSPDLSLLRFTLTGEERVDLSPGTRKEKGNACFPTLAKAGLGNRLIPGALGNLIGGIASHQSLECILTTVVACTGFTMVNSEGFPGHSEPSAENLMMHNSNVICCND